MSKAQSADAIEPLDAVAARALTESMSVLIEAPPVRGADGMFEVTIQSGSTYIVDAHEGACECPDTRYLDRTCKHQLRVAFETGRWEIPAWVDPDDVDWQLGEWVDTDPRWSECRSGVSSAGRPTAGCSTTTASRTPPTAIASSTSNAGTTTRSRRCCGYE